MVTRLLQRYTAMMQRSACAKLCNLHHTVLRPQACTRRPAHTPYPEEVHMTRTAQRAREDLQNSMEETPTGSVSVSMAPFSAAGRSGAGSMVRMESTCHHDATSLPETSHSTPSTF